MRRFWDHAAAEPVPGGHAIRLDGKPMRLPGGAELRVGPAPLAHAIAAEWQAAGGGKGGQMSFADTPLTRLAGTAQERIAAEREANAAALAAYADTDLLCYRADYPPDLVERQAAAWQPWLDWAHARHGARLRATVGIVHVAQDAAALAALRAAVQALEPDALAGLGVAVPALGSLVLGLALAEGAIDARRAHAVSALDELFEAERWGEDAEAEDRRARVAADVALAERFIRLARG